MKTDIEVVNDVGSDMLGSTYRDLKCEGCGLLVGRSYVSTASHQDHVRDAFTLNCEQIASYKVGSCKKGENREKQSGPVISLVGIDARKALLMNEQIAMVQKCVIDLAKEVKKIERGFVSSGHLPDKLEIDQDHTTGSQRYGKKLEDDEEYLPPGKSSSTLSEEAVITTTKNEGTFQLKQAFTKKKINSTSKLRRVTKSNSAKSNSAKKGQKNKWTKERLLSLQRGVEKYGGPKFDLIYADPEFGLGSFSSANVVKAAYYYHVYQGGGKNAKKRKKGTVIHQGKKKKEKKENNTEQTNTVQTNGV